MRKSPRRENLFTGNSLPSTLSREIFSDEIFCRRIVGRHGQPREVAVLASALRAGVEQLARDLPPSPSTAGLSISVRIIPFITEGGAMRAVPPEFRQQGLV